MTILEEQLGQAMTVQEVADYMKINSSTVRKYYRELGGVRFGKVERSDQTQDIFDKKESNRMGGRTKEKIQKIDEVRDKFNLLA